MTSLASCSTGTTSSKTKRVQRDWTKHKHRFKSSLLLIWESQPVFLVWWRFLNPLTLNFFFDHIKYTQCTVGQGSSTWFPRAPCWKDHNFRPRVCFANSIKMMSVVTQINIINCNIMKLNWTKFLFLKCVST